MTVPALRALRNSLPQAEITLHTRAPNEGIFRDADFIDQILPIDRVESSLSEVLEHSRKLRGGRFDAAIIFPNSFASALTARFAGIPRRFGYSKEMRRLFLTDPVTPPAWKNERHEIYYYFELVREVVNRLTNSKPLTEEPPTIDLTIAALRKNEARDFLAKRGLDLSRPTIAIGGGSTNSEAKRWPADRFVRLLRKLRSELDANVILLGSEGDRKVSDEIVAASDLTLLDLTGKTSIADAAAILSISDLLISNDMGLAHVAPAVGTKTIVIFGPTNPITTRPFSPLARVIRHEVECSPCMLRRCPIDHRCMIRIEPIQVFEAAKEMLE